VVGSGLLVRLVRRCQCSGRPGRRPGAYAACPPGPLSILNGAGQARQALRRRREVPAAQIGAERQPHCCTMQRLPPSASVWGGLARRFRRLWVEGAGYSTAD